MAGSGVRALTDEQRASFAARGSVRLPGFADRDTCTAMLDRVVDLLVTLARKDGLLK